MLSLHTGRGSHDVMTSRINRSMPAASQRACSGLVSEAQLSGQYKSSNADAVALSWAVDVVQIASTQGTQAHVGNLETPIRPGLTGLVAVDIRRLTESDYRPPYLQKTQVLSSERHNPINPHSPITPQYHTTFIALLSPAPSPVPYRLLQRTFPCTVRPLHCPFYRHVPCTDTSLVACLPQYRSVPSIVYTTAKRLVISLLVTGEKWLSCAGGVGDVTVEGTVQGTYVPPPYRHVPCSVPSIVPQRTFHSIYLQ